MEEMVTLEDSTSDEVGSCNYCPASLEPGRTPVEITTVVFHFAGNPQHVMGVRCCQVHLSQVIGQLLGKHLGRKARKRGG